MRIRVRAEVLLASSLGEDGRHHLLTAAVEYFVVGIGHIYYRIINDKGEPILYPKELFEVVDDALPPGWRFFEGTDGDYYLDPLKTAKPGFYEDYFYSDGDAKAQALAQESLHETFEELLDWGTELDRVVIRRDFERMLNCERRWPELKSQFRPKA